MLLFILLNFFIHISKTDKFNSKARLLHGAEATDKCSISIAPRQGIKDSWFKTNVPVDGRNATLKGVTYDSVFSNGNNFEINNWGLRINFDKDCFINNAWCGTVEIHQLSGTVEKVQTLDLRNLDNKSIILDYMTVDQDVLIQLRKGDYLIYHPDSINYENLIVPDGSITIGFILYLETTEDFSVDITDYHGFFNFHKKYSEGKETRTSIILFVIWCIAVIIRITTLITTIKTRSETEKKLTLQRMTELETYNQKIKEANRLLEESNSIIKAVTDIYHIIYSINLEDDTYHEIKTNPHTAEFLQQFLSAEKALKAIPEAMYIKEDHEKTMDFYDINNWAEKLMNADTCFLETKSYKTGWVRTNLIVSKRNEDGKPLHVLIAVQDIDKAVTEELERKRKLEEANRIIKSYNEALNSEVEAKTEHIKNIQNKVVRGLASVIGNRDQDTVGHVNRTSDILSIIIDEYRKQNPGIIDDVKAYDIIKAAPMHDLGKIYIDTAVLCKPGRFTVAEYEQMKCHSMFSGDIVNHVLKDVEEKHFVDVAFNIARFHHERWDGTGYPDRLTGTDIPIEARIMAIADVYDALVSKRCYKEPLNFADAFEIMIQGMGTQFDPNLKNTIIACQNQLEEYYTKNAN